MEVKEYIETIADWQNWKEFLMGHSKEELVELMINRMSRDSSYCRESYYKLVKRSLSVNETIDDYKTEVNYEMNKKIPDVYFLMILSDKLLERVECTDNLLDKLKLSVTVIVNLDCAIENGAGFRNEDEFVLIEVMDTCRDLMLAAIKKQYKDLSTEELSKVSDYLKTESARYCSIDNENRIETAFEKVVSLTEGRTGITKDGAYVRGASYYRNLK
ncbi:hypothetical protein [Acetobacterium tundrae]|uniref:Uncharacterized protein n=1 Tax=Acetobacterium tundrae TaxID=132932 RepID=A0ABR6WL68_9FIRM|nr:hypothetical protein [Acetobacterium tundrae]MBC3797253.1 hypothetical protein [Acetobacterium tundrae]